MSGQQQETQLTCHCCGVKLVQTEVDFSYMGHGMKHTVPACPKCGQVYIAPELARGKMRDVEYEMEDK